MTFHEWLDAQLGKWSTEKRWCDANPGIRHVPFPELAGLARAYCGERPEEAAADLWSLPGDVIAEINREASPAIDRARVAAMSRLYREAG